MTQNVHTHRNIALISIKQREHLWTMQLVVVSDTNGSKTTTHTWTGHPKWVKQRAGRELEHLYNAGIISHADPLEAALRKRNT